jgi:diguanylate cyclase (GGDEF)-like protein
MRQSLSSTAVELVSCVNKMAEDGKRAVEQLRFQVSSYQERVQEAERLAAIDALTGVASRRILERQLELRVSTGSPFCVVYLDLNGFKQINDTLGHTAGDDLLKLFAGELGHSLRATDCVGRVGGDEFVVLIDGSLETVRERMAVVANRINGNYTLSTEAGKRKIALTAALGIAAWKPGATAQQLLTAADRAMYHDKKRASEAKHNDSAAAKV